MKLGTNIRRLSGHCWVKSFSLSEVTGQGPVKIVPDMTYNVFGGTLNLAQSIRSRSLQGQENLYMTYVLSGEVMMKLATNNHHVSELLSALRFLTITALHKSTYLLTYLVKNCSSSDVREQGYSETKCIFVAEAYISMVWSQVLPVSDCKYGILQCPVSHSVFFRCW